MRIGMEVRKYGDIDPQGAEDLQPRRLVVDRSGIGELFVEVKVKVAYEHLETGHRLINIVVRESHHGLLSRAAVVRTQVEINGHALPRSRRSVIKSEVPEIVARLALAPLPHFVGHSVWPILLFVVGLPHAYGERIIAVLAVPHVTEIQLDFARKEKFV